MSCDYCNYYLHLTYVLRQGIYSGLLKFNTCQIIFNLVKKETMQNITHSTPVIKLNRIKIGDNIVDEYNSQGRVVKIRKSVVNNLREYLFHLDSRQTIYILSSSF